MPYSARQVRPLYFSEGLWQESGADSVLTPSAPKLFFFPPDHNKGRLTAGMEKPMVWSTNTDRARSGGRSSFLLCLFKDKETQSVHMGSSNLTINYMNGCQKGTPSWSEPSQRHLGFRTLCTRWPQTSPVELLSGLTILSV